MKHILLIYNLVRDFLKRMKDDHVGAYASQAAYFMMLSFIPIIMLLLALIKYTPVTETMIQRLLNESMPAAVYPMVMSIVEEVYNRSVNLIPVTILVALWSSGRALLAISRGLNRIYGVSETRNYIALRVRSTIHTVFMLVSIVLSLTVLVFGNMIHELIQRRIPIIAHITGFVISARTLIMLTALVMFFTLIYRYLPNRKAPLLLQVPGAVFTASAWSGFSFVFSLYVDWFGNYSRIYGSLTTLILVMLWLYACMYIAMIGAAVNSYYEAKFQEFHEIARRKKFIRKH